MNCPHCQKDLPENYSANWCPFCGKDLSPENSRTLHELPPVKFRGFLFWGALLLPALLTLLSAAAMRFILSQPRTEVVALWVGLIGGIIGGVICGVMLGIQGSKKLPARIFISILMSVIMIVVCVVLCFFGCSMGGYQFDIH